MATVIPPPSKKQRRQAQEPLPEIKENYPHVVVQFKASDTGESAGSNIRIPSDVTEAKLELLLNQLLGSSDDPVPYSFSVKLDNEEKPPVDITEDLYQSVIKPGLRSAEDHLTLLYTPRAVFKVRPITRCSASMTSHKATILCAQFAPGTSTRLITGSGDCTSRIWDCETQTPLKTLSGHSDWVLSASWSPDGEMVATGSKDGSIRIWDPTTGNQIGKPLYGHTKWITSLSWEPLHMKGSSYRLASSSKDTTIRIWDVETGVTLFSMTSHKSTVSCVKWGGIGFIYSTSHDKTIKVWSADDGRLINTLNSHAHWVNHLSLSTEFALRTGAFDERGNIGDATERFEKLAKIQGRISEKIVTASDDFTMYLWEPAKTTKPLCRMTGHQKLVNHVSFSPDGRYIASASFDNSIKIWDGRDGKFVTTFRGHVAAVYQCAWSSDCRLLVSCSKDTTLKVWDMKTKKLFSDLPGHADEIYAVDWSPDGRRVASGGKDKTVKLWVH